MAASNVSQAALNDHFVGHFVEIVVMAVNVEIDSFIDDVNDNNSDEMETFLSNVSAVVVPHPHHSHRLVGRRRCPPPTPAFSSPHLGTTL
jgi:hypothetical protein